MAICARPGGMGSEGSCQGQDRAREGTCTKEEQAGPQRSSLRQGPEVFGKKAKAARAKVYRKVPSSPSLQLRPLHGSPALPQAESWRGAPAPPPDI